jgi:hypothetical protein
MGYEELIRHKGIFSVDTDYMKCFESTGIVGFLKMKARI